MVMVIYNLGILLYEWLLHVAALWKPKARQWVDGRRNIFDRMAERISPSDRVVWMHVASLGEFEQGRPILEAIRKEHPEMKLLAFGI